MNNEKQLQEQTFIKATKFEKFCAIAGIAAQAVVTTRAQYTTDVTPIGIIAGLGLGYLGMILSRHINPEKNIKKAAFLTIAGGSLVAAGILSDFAKDQITDTLLILPTIVLVAGISIVPERLRDYTNKKKNNNKI